LGEGVIGRVVELGRPVVIDQISKSNLFLNRTQQELTKDGEELTFICVPIVESGKVTGALSVIRVFNPHIMYEEDIQLMSIIGSMISNVFVPNRNAWKKLKLLIQKNQHLEIMLRENHPPGQYELGIRPRIRMCMR
jgi:Nif-specific regulatory protein